MRSLLLLMSALSASFLGCGATTPEAKEPSFALDSDSFAAKPRLIEIDSSHKSDAGAALTVPGLSTAKAVVEIHTADGSHQTPELSAELRQALSASLQELQVAVVPEPRRLSDVKAALTQHRATPLIVNASLVSLQQRQRDGIVYWEATVTMSLADHPGGVLRAILTEKAAVSRASRTYRSALHDAPMRHKAVNEAARAVSQGLLVSLAVL